MASSNYWLTFRIADDTVNQVTGYARRDALYDAVDKLSSGWWPDSTSFLIFDSTKTIDQVAAACKAAIAPGYDLVLLRELDTKNARIIGKVPNLETLKAYMPYVSKV